ncbi:hypothetical protein [Clostridium sartagoforme]|nr:hypothetical protein [Clostridium sartagoforme]
MRELLHIKDILVDINSSNIEIKFICDEEINKKELEEFYFITKVFKSIHTFSSKMNLNPKLFFNNDEWKMFNNIIENKD